jgi:glycosyltransferase involved in cell wall biosynthesis
MGLHRLKPFSSESSVVSVIATGPINAPTPDCRLSPFPANTRHALEGRSILQIIPELEAGGAERTTVDIAEALASLGARALVATEGGRLVGELQAKGGEWLPFPAASKNPAAMVLNASRLASLIRREKVDIVHARSRAPAWVALAATKFTRTPFLTTYHGSYSGKSPPKVLYNSVMARGEVVIANSEYTAGLIRAMHPFAASIIRVIPRGTDLSAFQAHAIDPARVLALRENWNVGPHERIVLLAARLTGWKGQRVLIDAAKIMTDQGLRDVVFLLAGDAQGRDDYVKELDGLIQSRGVTGVVRRVGHVTDMPAAMMAAAAVAVPSIEPEAFGRVAVEAQAIGAPVVVSNLGAVPETVLAPPDVASEARTGWRVPPGDAVALADALMQALSLRPSARDALAQRGRRHAEAHFSLQQMVEKTLDVYAALIERRQNT